MAVTAAPTWQDLYDQFQAHAIGLRPRLSFADGTIPDLEAGGAASVADRIIAYAAEAVRNTYLYGATGEALTVLANDHYNIQRSQGAYATIVGYTFSRANAAAGGGTIPAGFRVATTVDALGRSQVFLTTAAVTFGALDLSKTVDVRAELRGIDYNVAASTVTRLLDTPFDPLITGTNAAAAAGGADEETDDELRERVRGQPLSWRRATLYALEYGAKTVAGVGTASAVEDAAGFVTVYVADAEGNSNQTMVDNVTTELENWAAAGAAWQVSGGSLVTQNVVLTLAARAGVDTSALFTRVADAIEARINKLRHGETLYRDMIIQAARNAGGDDLTAVTVVTPAADLVADPPSKVIRCGTVTVS